MPGTPPVKPAIVRSVRSQARTYGSGRSQLMQVYVQKLTTTTFPRQASAVCGGELSQSFAPPRDGKRPSAGSDNP
jgi:hypothetical protein